MWGVCVCVEEDLHIWFAQSGLTFKGVYDKNTYLFVELLLCMIDLRSTSAVTFSSHKNSVGVGTIVIPIL